MDIQSRRSNVSKAYSKISKSPSQISKAASNFSKGRFERRMEEEVTKADSVMEKVNEEPLEEEVQDLEYNSDPERF